jgi:uncharacterized protein YhbP (UPF0306 family)
MAIERSKRQVAAARMARTARSLLDASTLCAIATVGPGGRAHVHTAYFAWTPEFELVWMSEPRARHSRNIRANGAAAVAVYDSSQERGRPDRGIQLHGSAREAKTAAADRAYANRFPDFRAGELGAYRFYSFRPRRLKLFDEEELGPGWFVTARVAAGGRLAWERTEIYRSAA